MSICKKIIKFSVCRMIFKVLTNKMFFFAFKWFGSALKHSKITKVARRRQKKYGKINFFRENTWLFPALVVADLTTRGGNNLWNWSDAFLVSNRDNSEDFCQETILLQLAWCISVQWAIRSLWWELIGIDSEIRCKHFISVCGLKLSNDTSVPE